MRKDILLVGVIVASLTLMVIPLSSTIIDVLLAVNLSLGVLLLMVSVYLKHPSDFSTFPSVILIGTAFRLALSIGTTRLILSEAEAGAIIETFGEFVVSGSIAIGLVIFLIITVVQFVVVTKGAERVAEVGARFALDALPGKQMSIDAEARAGNITAEEAAVRRRRLDRESRFFGAMDGAMKFVKGDAIAGLIIICINLIGGLAVGVTSHGLSFGEAASIFSLLTIGDGLVAQIPALLMSLCAGIIVTRADGQGGKDLGSDISAEIIADPRVPAIGAPIVLGIGLIPGFPTMIFGAMAAGMLLISVAVRRSLLAQERQQAAPPAEAQAASRDNDTGLLDNRVIFGIGETLVSEIDLASVRDRLSSHVTALHAARGVEFACPVVETRPLSDPRSLVIEIDEVPISRETVPENHVLTVGQTPAYLKTELGVEPGNVWPLIDGVWIADAAKADLDAAEVPIADIETGLADLGFRVFEQNLGALFSHATFERFLDAARSAEPAQMEKIEAQLDAGAMYKMLRYLVEDGVPLRPLSLVVSSINYWLVTVAEKEPVILAECLRGSMKRQLCHRIAGEAGVLGLAMVDPRLEADLRRGAADTSNRPIDFANMGLSLDPQTNDRLVDHVRKLLDRGRSNGQHVAIVVAADLRRRLRNHLANYNLHLPVLAAHEIATETTSYPLDLIGKVEEASTRRRPVRGRSTATA